MVYVGILAAGMGVRMHRQDLPKQFLPLGEKPIIIHTLEQFFLNDLVGKIIVVAPDSWMLYAEDLIAKYNQIGKEVFVISGGDSKTESVCAIVRYIEVSFGITAEDILITHDAIRPFITQRIINENIETAAKHGAANTAMPTTDTIVVSYDGKALSDIPSKMAMYAEQTPQTFKIETLKSVFEQAEKSGASLKNEEELARLYIRSGNAIRIVRGEYSNMKIINPYDLEVANALLKERKL